MYHDVSIAPHHPLRDLQPYQRHPKFKEDNDKFNHEKDAVWIAKKIILGPEVNAKNETVYTVRWYKLKKSQDSHITLEEGKKSIGFEECLKEHNAKSNVN